MLKGFVSFDTFHSTQSFQFAAIGPKLDYTKSLFIRMLKTFIVVLTNVPMAFASYYLEKSFLKSWLYFYSSVYFTMSILGTTSLLDTIGWRLRSVITTLDMLTANDSSVSDKQFAKILQGLMDIYFDLVDINDSLSIFSCVPCLLGYGLVFFHTLIIDFLLFQDLYEFGAPTTTTFVGLMYAFFFVVIFVELVYVVNVNKRISRAIVTSCNNAVKKSTSDDRAIRLLALSSFANRNILRLSCGLFEFDWKLLLSTISGAATNLIILIQFELVAKGRNEQEE